ncbi:MAG: ATP-binding protein [Betaproteobacteria bacterium]|jgi:DNA-binding CsgD family transcriptional regulator
MPQALNPGPATALLERDAALAQLRHELAGTAARGRVVLVAGEAGIGKTSVLQALAEGHEPVWWGACDALQTPLPLAPLLDMARQARVRFAAQLQGPRPALFEAVLDEMRLATGPLLVVVEDAHWADDATLDLLKYLGRRIERSHALLAISYRDDEVTATHPLRRLLGELPPTTTTRLTLPPLSPAAVEAMARSLGRNAGDVHAVTRGNAFFVTEMLRDGGSSGSAVPARVQDVVLARFARLGPGAQALLQRVAVMPGRAERAVLEAIQPSSDEDLDAALASGLLLAEGDELRYRHELGRVAVESSLSVPAARQLHRQVLAVLSQAARQTAAARLSHHALQSGDRDAVSRFAPQAARDAEGRMAYREAAAHWQAALEHGRAHDEAQRMDWLDAFAAAKTFGSGHAQTLKALRELQALAERRGDTLRAALSLSRQVAPLTGQLRYAEARQAIEQALAMIEPLPSSASHAAVWAREAHLRMLDRDYARSIHWGRRALALASERGETEVAERARTALGAALLFVDYPAGRDMLQALIDERRASRRTSPLAMSLAMLGSGNGELMHLADAERQLRESVSLCEAGDIEFDYPRAWLALVLMLRGHWQEAGNEAARVIAHEQADEVSRLMAWLAVGRLRLRRGDPGVSDAIEAARPLAEASATLQRQAPFACLRAEAALAAGRPQDAAAMLRAALPLALGRAHPWFVGEMAYGLWRSGAPEPAATALAAEPYQLEMAGRWHEAADAWQRLEMPYERSRAMAMGDTAARLEALAAFDALGARPAAETLRRQLRDSGERGVPRGARETTRAHPAGLTTAEMRTLALLADGLRNADIAARLHRSVRTVDHHVAAVLSKLGAASRHEAVAKAHRQGWLQGPARTD